jgi:hypothetical protein
MQIIRAVAAGSLIFLASLAPSDSEAQSIARRVASVRDGKVRMTYPARPDLCGWGNGISTRSSHNNTTRSWNAEQNDDVAFDDECSVGPARLVLTLSEGRVERIRAYVGGGDQLPM